MYNLTGSPHMEHYAEIKNIIEEFLNAMGISGFSIEIKSPHADYPAMFSVSIANAGQLIGNKGGTIFFLEHLIKIMVKKKFPDSTLFIIDINDYRKTKENFLRELARTAAQKVALSGRDEALPPMNAYERRIIHMELTTRPDVVTESQGEGPERYLVIKPNK